MTAASPLFEARAVGKRWRADGSESAALVDVSLSIPRGAFAAITGPSGSGKSTLLALLGALDRPSTGAVLFDGQDTTEVSESERTRIRRRIGFVFQSFPMIRRLPVWENVTYPLVPSGASSAVRRKRAEKLLARVGAGALLDKRPETLSGGECQRVGLARALVADPAALLADEPTSNLDPRSAEAVAAILASLHAAGSTVVVATHDPRLISLASTVYELESGRLASSLPSRK